MSRRFIVVIVSLIVLTQMTSSAFAQTASPVAGECQLPPLVPEPVFPDMVRPPVNASPVASPAAQPVEPELAAQIETVTRALGACLADGNAAGVADIATADFLGDAFGGGERLSRDDYLALAASAPVIPVRINTVSNPVYTGMRTVASEVELVAGNQLRLERWTFVFRMNSESGPSTPAASPAPPRGRWMAHRTEPLIPQAPTGATRVQATLNEYTISLEDNSLDGPDVILDGRNAGAEAHELLVLRLTGGAAAASLLRPSPDGFPAGIAVVGQATLEPGEQVDLVLVEMPAGDYIIVCLFPDTSGVPHLSFGQVTTFTVR